MAPFLYLLLFLTPILFVAVIVVYLIYKKNSHTGLYAEGVRNENNGNYEQALHNYEDALSEIRKLRLNDKFSIKITERIKILRTTIEYENNFQVRHSALNQSTA